MTVLKKFTRLLKKQIYNFDELLRLTHSLGVLWQIDLHCVTQPPVFKTIASRQELSKKPQISLNHRELSLTEKAYKLIQQKLIQHIDKKKLQPYAAEALKDEKFNLYSFVDTYV